MRRAFIGAGARALIGLVFAAGGCGGSAKSTRSEGGSPAHETAGSGGSGGSDKGMAGRQTGGGEVGVAGTEASGGALANGGQGGAETTGEQAGAGGQAGDAGAPCGGYDEPCCGASCSNPDSFCEPAIANGPLCRRCGVPGAKCCDGEAGKAERCSGGCCVMKQISALCIAFDETCPVGGACDADGSCGTCGGPGEPCCQEYEEMPRSAWWCAARATCLRDADGATTHCEACGALGEICCYDPEDAFGLGHCAANLACSNRSSPRRCVEPL